MKFTLFGLPKTGKTTLFNLLTKSALETSRFAATEKSVHVGTCVVEDPRVTELSKIFNPKKTTYARIDFSDLGGLAFGDVKETELLPHLRNSDGLAHVLRAFEDDEMPHPGGVDPVRDMERMEDELILADLIVAESRLERLAKDLKKGKRPELAKEEEILIRCREILSAGKPLREEAFSEEDLKLIRGFMFLSQKPLLAVVNLGESDTSRINRADELRPERFRNTTNVVISPVSAAIETEISRLSGEEAAEYLSAYGLKEPALSRLIRDSYALLGLISFFTVGEDEVRAWTVKRDSPARAAAGVIHSDLEKGFIRAEVVTYADFMESGSLAACRQKGTLRLEGKEYPVKDGEIIHFRSGL